jgi:KaiC/GvpD/RAD55 family RecA-like ATPase
VRVLHIQQEWFDRLLPDGLPIPSSTLLSGPGGSGKPLIGNVIAAAWLRQGGSVIFMSLQYPDHSFIKAGLSKVAHLDLDEYKERVVFIELDATIDTMTEPDDNRFRANVVKPEVWDRAI